MKKTQSQNDQFNCYVLTKDEAKHIEDEFIKSSPQLTIPSVVISAIISIIGIVLPLFIDISTELRISITIVFVLILICCFFLWNKKILKKMQNIISTTALEKAHHTGICLITEPYGNDISLVSESDIYEYLTFVDLKKCTNNGEVNEELIKKELAGKMDFDPKCIEKTIHLGQKCFTKRARDNSNIVEQTICEFYYVRFKDGSKKTINAKMDTHNYRWVSLNDLQSRDKISLQNNDVLSKIKELLQKDDEGKYLRTGSFPEDTVIKVIWNIANTKTCGQNCSICATDSDRKCVSSHEKSTILSRIIEYADHISEIDFSGGDPLLDKDDRDIILRTISILKDRNVDIFVTTTQKGIVQAPRDKNLSKLLRNTEITLDIGNIEDNNRVDYNKRNKKLFNNTSNLLNNYAENIYVNVPIINVEASEEDIQKVVSIIKSLKNKPKRINVMRLMKVGKCDFSVPASLTERKQYKNNLIRTIQLLRRQLGSDYDVHLHCALRGLEEKDFRCDLRDKKIGIDCAGNVFACAWGGYIDHGTNYNENNKFYLGNLLNNSLEEILNMSRENGKVEPRDTCACCVYSYITNGNPYDNSDFLYIDVKET